MKVCVIGGTGHIGRFLTPMLVRNGHDVTVVTSGRTPTPAGPEWQKVKFKAGRYSFNDKAWSDLLRDIGPEVLIDILGSDVPALYQALKPTCRHLVVCGSTWMWGPPRIVPTPPAIQNPCEFQDYARRIREMHEIKALAKKEGIMAFTGAMPPNICGPGKIPLDTIGDRSLDCFRALKAGKPAILPDGCNTLIGPCDAADIALVFALAVEKRQAAADEIFNCGAAYALTAAQVVEVYARILGVKVPIEYVGWEKFLKEIMPDPGSNYHYREHMCPDISKTRAKLGYAPQFTPEATMERAVAWMRDEKLI